MSIGLRMCLKNGLFIILISLIGGLLNGLVKDLTGLDSDSFFGFMCGFIYALYKPR